MALVLTLLVVVLLVTAVLEFDQSTRTTLKAAGNFRDGLKAFYLATSGIAAAQAVLKDDKNRTQIDSLTELWATPFPPYPLGDGTVAVAIQDEGGKINVNALVNPDGTIHLPLAIEQLKKLFQLKGLDPAPVDAIVDWLDRDDVEEPGGAETVYYQRLDRPYHCRNGQFETLAELHLVKGITDEVYRAISPYLTVYGNKFGGENKINVNTADPLVLRTLPIKEPNQAQVTFPLDEAQVDKLVDARPFSILTQLNQVSGMSSAVVSQLQSQLDVRSQHFSVYAEGAANGVKKAVLAVVDRSGEPTLRYWRLAD
ncbi:MAG: type II secretion system minor pseudopilin GspK [Nitrospirae bacterium]|nr:type II secretion system minor pseudopilin GspK [Nitrospirota bacterium]